METQKRIQDAIDTLQMIQSDLSKNEGVSKERILNYLAEYQKNCEEELEAGDMRMKAYCEKMIAGQVDVNESFFKDIADYKEDYDYNIGRVRMIAYVISAIKNNFNEED